MALIDELEGQGRWLFRWRGYLPLTVLALSFLTVLSEQVRGETWLPFGPWQQLCIGICTLGLLIRVIAIGHAPAGTSERTTGRPRAASLSTSGLYSLVRHPLYLGNFFLMLGVVMCARSFSLSIWFVLSFWLYYERIIAAEEAFLRREFGQAFEDWARVTPTFLPRLRRWTPPAFAFSLRNVLRREYNGFFAVFASMFLLDIARNRSAYGLWQADTDWEVVLAVALVIWLALRTLKRFTSVLRVPGR